MITLNGPTISKNNINIMEYLIKKLESREKKINKLKNFFYSLNAFQDFYSNKKEILNSFTELENDLKQASCAIKALLIENQALTIEIENKDLTINNYINENNILTSENENLKNQILMYNNNNNNNINDVNDLYNISGNNINEENEMLNNQNNYFQNEEIEVNQLSNVKNIMNDIKTNKQKLKNAIEKHFNNTNNNSEINNYNSNNNSLQVSEELDYNNYINENRANNLIMNIMNNPENIKLLNYSLGKDFMQKILNPNCPQNYLDEVERILTENYMNNNNNDNKKKKLPIRLNINNISNISNENKEIKNKKLNNSFTSNRCQSLKKMKDGLSFEKSLRDYPNQNTSSYKRFNNFTNPYGDYFEKNKKNI
jgi:hypothetical protein